MTVRIVTWNIWWKFGPWHHRQPAITETLRRLDPDVVCLQEVYPATDDEPCQAERLAGELGMQHATSFEPHRPWMGNAVLSRWPITDAERLGLPAAPGRRETRSAVLAHIDAPFGPLPVASTHLNYEFDHSALRIAQVQAIGRWLRPHTTRDAPFPVVLCGDLNARPESDEIRMLTGLTPGLPSGFVFQDVWDLAGEGRGVTWASTNPYQQGSKWPDRRLDYVLVSVPRTPPAGTVERVGLAGTTPIDGVWPSDHFAVVADLDTPGAG